MMPLARILLALLIGSAFCRSEESHFSFLQIGVNYRITCAENIKLPLTFKVIARTGGDWVQVEYAPKLVYVLPADGTPHPAAPAKGQMKKMWINLSEVAGIEEAAAQ